MSLWGTSALPKVKPIVVRFVAINWKKNPQKGMTTVKSRLFDQFWSFGNKEHLTLRNNLAVTKKFPYYQFWMYQIKSRQNASFFQSCSILLILDAKNLQELARIQFTTEGTIAQAMHGIFIPDYWQILILICLLMKIDWFYFFSEIYFII